MAREQTVVGQPAGREAVNARRDPAAASPLRSDVRALRQALDDCRAAQEALRESEDLHRVILENISDAVFLTDDAGTFTFVCPNCDVIFGHSREETWELGRISALLGAGIHALPQLATGEPVVNHECNVLNKAGDCRTLLVNIKRVSIGSGTLLYVCRDISDRRAAQAALQASEERYRDIVEDQTELICRFLPDGTLTFVNGAYARYFGRRAEELVGTTFWPLIPQEAHEASRAFLASITPDHPVATIEHPVNAPGGGSDRPEGTASSPTPTP